MTDRTTGVLEGFCAGQRLRQRFDTQGLEPAYSGSLDEAQRFYRKEAVRWAGVIKATGIKPQQAPDGAWSVTQQ